MSQNEYSTHKTSLISSLKQFKINFDGLAKKDHGARINSVPIINTTYSYYEYNLLADIFVRGAEMIMSGTSDLDRESGLAEARNIMLLHLNESARIRIADGILIAKAPSIEVDALNTVFTVSDTILMSCIWTVLTSNLKQPDSIECYLLAFKLITDMIHDQRFLFHIYATPIENLRVVFRNALKCAELAENFHIVDAVNNALRIHDEVNKRYYSLRAKHKSCANS